MFTFLLAAEVEFQPPKYRDLHKHHTKVHIGQVFEEGCKDLQFSSVSISTLTHEGHWAYTPRRKFAAFEAEHEDPEFKDARQVMVVFDAKKKAFTQIRSALFSHRDYASPKWVNDHILQFDIWTGPSYGVHYLVDVQQMKVIWAKHFDGEY